MTSLTRNKFLSILSRRRRNFRLRTVYEMYENGKICAQKVRKYRILVQRDENIKILYLARDLATGVGWLTFLKALKKSLILIEGSFPSQRENPDPFTSLGHPNVIDFAKKINFLDAL